MSSKLVMRGMIAFYIFLFFAYLFGPLLVMSVTAFNTPNYPQAYPFEAFTLNWFVKLWNHRAMMDGIKNSVIIGLGVVATKARRVTDDESSTTSKCGVSLSNAARAASRVSMGRTPSRHRLAIADGTTVSAGRLTATAAPVTRASSASVSGSRR